MSAVTDEMEVSSVGGMIYHYERALIMEWVTLKSLFPVLFILFTFDCLTMVDFSCLNISVRCHIKSAGVSKMFTEGQKETFERYLSEEAAGSHWNILHQLKWLCALKLRRRLQLQVTGSFGYYFWTPTVVNGATINIQDLIQLLSHEHLLSFEMPGGILTVIYMHGCFMCHFQPSLDILDMLTLLKLHQKSKVSQLSRVSHNKQQSKIPLNTTLYLKIIFRSIW